MKKACTSTNISLNLHSKLILWLKRTFLLTSKKPACWHNVAHLLSHMTTTFTWYDLSWFFYRYFIKMHFPKVNSSYIWLTFISVQKVRRVPVISYSAKLRSFMMPPYLPSNYHWQIYMNVNSYELRRKI